jgi:hypothetical protein
LWIPLLFRSVTDIHPLLKATTSSYFQFIMTTEIKQLTDSNWQSLLWKRFFRNQSSESGKDPTVTGLIQSCHMSRKAVEKIIISTPRLFSGLKHCHDSKGFSAFI